jgi:hypothetical protein
MTIVRDHGSFRDPSGLLAHYGDRIFRILREDAFSTFACEQRLCTDIGWIRSSHRKKTRPPAQYDAAAALPCPDIKIGSRHPVPISWRVPARPCVIHFTMDQKNRQALKTACLDTKERGSIP